MCLIVCGCIIMLITPNYDVTELAVIEAEAFAHLSDIFFSFTQVNIFPKFDLYEIFCFD